MPGSTFVGNTGEYYVMAELLRRGWVAGLSPRNLPDFDILAIAEDKEVRLRCKTKTHKSTVWKFTTRIDEPKIVYRNAKREGDFTILVDIPKDDNLPPDYFIIPTDFLNKWLYQDFYFWVNEPNPPKGRKKDSTMRNLHRRPYEEALTLLHNKWNYLWKDRSDIEPILADVMRLAEIEPHVVD